MSEKKRAPIAARAFMEITPERKEEVKQRLLKNRAALTLAYQLGHYVGKQIVDKFLPTLSVDSPQTRKVISVTVAEGDECRRLDKVWYAKRSSIKGSESKQSKESKKEWDELRAYHEMLEAKYLKPTIDCHFQVLNVLPEHMADFKRGVGDTLWNCDCSHYSTKPENIEVIPDEEGWFVNIRLKRD